MTTVVEVKCSIPYALRNEGAAAMGEDKLRRLAAERIEKLEDVAEEIDAELDRQVYLSSGRDEYAFGSRESDMDLPADYEHHVVITEALWDKLRKLIRNG